MIGAGVSGIMMAYKMQKMCPEMEFKIYEKNNDLGGTWYENRYPGCGCDIPSHAYAFPWAPNVGSPTRFPPSRNSICQPMIDFGLNSPTGRDSSLMLLTYGSISIRCAMCSSFGKR
jgi:cation diffusion facilitator CzcD-associated flavoprotein CzcO